MNISVCIEKKMGCTLAEMYLTSFCEDLATDSKKF